MAYTYQLICRDETVGALTITLVQLRDFDEAVDGVFQELDARGEGERLVELCPFFGKLWPSARGLARYLSGLDLAGLRVLEVGCGLALPSLVAARLGAEVTATDFHPEVPVFLERNLRLNDGIAVTYRHADWRDAGAGLGRYDVICGSDVLYDRDQPEELARFAYRHLAPGGRVLVADPGRAFLQDFATAMERLGFASDVRADRVADGDGTKDVYVLVFTSTPGALPPEPRTAADRPAAAP